MVKITCDICGIEIDLDLDYIPYVCYHSEDKFEKKHLCPRCLKDRLGFIDRNIKLSP